MARCLGTLPEIWQHAILCLFCARSSPRTEATTPLTTRMPFSEPVSYRSNLHEPLLQRAAESSGESSREHALGAFLTMRLVDQFCAPAEDWHTNALAYQIRATNNHLDDLHPPSVEGNHLLEIVRVADGVRTSGKARVLFPPLLAFAYWLEGELRLEEALDVLDSTIALSDGREGEEEVATFLQRGRVLRKLGRFEQARESYGTAGKLALHLGDLHSELLSRVGRAKVSQKLGNLPEAERMLCAVLDDSQRLGDRDAEARACHDLAVTRDLMDHTLSAVQLAFRAFHLYEQPAQRARALGDTGIFLKELGHYTAAKQALLRAVESRASTELQARFTVELMHLSALMQDRVSFERWRRDSDERCETLPPDEQVEFEVKLGYGLAVFGQKAEGETHLERAIAVAEQHSLGEPVFRAEALLRELRECRQQSLPATALPAEGQPAPELQTTIQSREALGAVG